MSKMADIDIERKEIILEAKEMGYGMDDQTQGLKNLRPLLESVRDSWDGTSKMCIGTDYVGGEIVTEEQATWAADLIKRIDNLWK